MEVNEYIFITDALSVKCYVMVKYVALLQHCYYFVSLKRKKVTRQRKHVFRVCFGLCL